MTHTITLIPGDGIGPEVTEAVRLGVAGLVMKDSTPDTLIQCVRKVHGGGQWLDHEIVNRAFKSQLDREAAVRD